MEVFIYILIFSFSVNFASFQKEDKSAKILIGKDCDPEIHKFMVIVYGEISGNGCGGTIINKYWILTAAHCCELKMVVKTGRSMAYSNDSLYIEVSRVYQHPQYRNSHASHDIALLKLSEPLMESEHVKYIKLPNKPINEFCVEALVMGWGLVTWPKPSRKEIIQCVMLPVIGARKCKILLPEVESSHICTLSFEGKTSCFGDSGGPLICDDTEVGIVSFGYGCGQPFQPVAYTRVDYYHDFIHDTMLNTSNIAKYYLHTVLLGFVLLYEFFLCL